MAGIQHFEQRQGAKEETLSGMVAAVLFDLDDTLFDHRRSAGDALRAIHHAFECFRNVPFEEVEQHHSALLEEIHPDVVSARLGIDEARRERFRRLFLQFGVEDAQELSSAAATRYRQRYLEARRAVAGAPALLEAVHRRARIGIVSNNLLQEQMEKLDHCALAPYVDALIVSEQTGVSKPDPAIFEIALHALQVGPEETVMLGDSWAADIAGARAASIRAVWFNPLRLPSPQPHWEVPEVYALEPVEAVMRVLGL